MTANEIEALNGYDGATPMPEDFAAFWQARMAEADGVPCRDRSLPWPQRWRLLTDWIRSHLNVFDEATGEASAERQQRRLRARRTGQPSRPT